MMAFERLEPFGALMEEFRIGQVAAVIANVNRDPKLTPDAYTSDDFMPALRRAVTGPERAPRGADLDAETLSNLFDAEIFGRAPTLH